MIKKSSLSKKQSYIFTMEQSSFRNGAGCMKQHMDMLVFPNVGSPVANAVFSPTPPHILPNIARSASPLLCLRLIADMSHMPQSVTLVLFLMLLNACACIVLIVNCLPLIMLLILVHHLCDNAPIHVRFATPGRANGHGAEVKRGAPLVVDDTLADGPQRVLVTRTEGKIRSNVQLVAFEKVVIQLYVCSGRISLHGMARSLAWLSTLSTLLLFILDLLFILETEKIYRPKKSRGR